METYHYKFPYPGCFTSSFISMYCAYLVKKEGDLDFI
jgi:hypothetical protein